MGKHGSRTCKQHFDAAGLPPADLDGRQVQRFGRGPAKRTQMQHKDLAAHMRYCKLRKKLQLARQAPESIEQINGAGARKMTAHQMCSIAFGTCQRRTYLAERYAVSKQTIRRTLAFTALTVLEIQLKQLQEFEHFASLKQPDFAVASLSWDETSQVLALEAMPANANASVLRHQTSSSWEVMVSKLHLAVGWVNGIKLYHEFIMPPIPLSSNSASSLYNGLFARPLLVPLLGRVDAILKASKLSTWIHETDGHLANEKLHCHLYHERLGPSDAGAHGAASLPCLTEQVLCQNHQVQLALVATVDSLPKVEETGGRIIPNLFCATLFLRMGGHFVRLLCSVQHLVKDATFFRWVPQPSVDELQEGRRFSQELISFLVENLQHNSREMSTKKGGAVSHR